MTANSFRAMLLGKCGACGDVVAVGDHVTYLENALVHLRCHDAVHPRQRLTICPNCRLAFPCDCEELT